MTSDVITQWSLLAGGLAASLVFLLRHQLYFGVSAAALLFLGADEGLDIHEKVGKWAEGHLGTPPLVQDADAVVLGAWGALFLGVTALRWRDLAAVRAAACAWCGGTAIAAAAVGMDGLVPHDVRGSHSEEYLEVAAVIAVSGAYGLHAGAAALSLRPARSEATGAAVEP